MSVETFLPELVAAPTGMDAAQSQDVLGTGPAPEHAGLLAARADYGLAAGLHDPGTDEEALPTKSPVLHSFYIVNEVAQFLVNLLSLRLVGAFLAGFLNEVFDPIAQQAPDPAATPSLVLGVFFAPQECRHHLPGMVGPMIEVNDLEGVLEIQVAHVFQALSPIHQVDDFFGFAQAAPDGFLSQQRTELLQRPQVGDISGRFVVPH